MTQTLPHRRFFIDPKLHLALAITMGSVSGCGDPLAVEDKPTSIQAPEMLIGLKPPWKRSFSLKIEANASPISENPRLQFRGFDFTSDRIQALKPLVRDIMRDYRNPTTDLERARALRDWVARIAIHPFPPLHPDGTTRNIEVLPPGVEWADVNRLYSRKFNEDSQYWHDIHFQGDVMLDRLLGTLLDPTTGRRADDGMMLRIRGSRYQIRDIEQYRYVLCSYQDAILTALWAAAGLHGMLISTNGHDPAAVFIPDLGRWIYEDPTFNEGFIPVGMPYYPVSPSELLEVSHRGWISKLQATTTLGPNWSLEPYIVGAVDPSASYFSMLGRGMSVLGSKLNSGFKTPGEPYDPQNTQIITPGLPSIEPFNNPAAYIHVQDPALSFPTLGVHVVVSDTTNRGFVLSLSSNVPNHQRFEKRINGKKWLEAASIDTVFFEKSKVEYSTVDNAGRRSMVSRIVVSQ